MEQSQRIDLAGLNLRAGRKTFDASAFGPSSEYLRKAIELLAEDHWQEEYPLSLDLFSTAAETFFCIGNFDLSETYCHAILEQSHRPLLHNRRA